MGHVKNQFKIKIQLDEIKISATNLGSERQLVPVLRIDDAWIRLKYQLFTSGLHSRTGHRHQQVNHLRKTLEKKNLAD